MGCGVIGLINWNDVIDGVSQMVFFEAVYSFLRESIDNFAAGTLDRATHLVAGAALTGLTIWFMIQGYRIITGQSRESMSALMANSARAALICVCASSFAFYNTDLKDLIVNDLGGQITEVVTGEDGDPTAMIDKNLAVMTFAMMAIDQVKAADDEPLDKDKRQAKVMAGIGVGGPAIVAGAMLLLYQIAIALFVGFGPIFILCLLFDQTKSLFMRWLFYGIGTLFSQAVLVFVTAVAMEMVARVAAAIWLPNLVAHFAPNLDVIAQQGLNAQAVQQGGMGLILSTLILSTPPMAAMFFQGALGNFSPFVSMGGQFNGATNGPPGSPQHSLPNTATTAAR